MFKLRKIRKKTSYHVLIKSIDLNSNFFLYFIFSMYICMSNLHSMYLFFSFFLVNSAYINIKFNDNCTLYIYNCNLVKKNFHVSFFSEMN